jgi:hypothetical protein
MTLTFQNTGSGGRVPAVGQKASLVPPPSSTRSAGALPGAIVLACFLFGCAGQVPPSGGPPDTIPPRVVRTDPDTNAVRVTKRTITLEFSEYVDRRSVQDAVFISPSLGELEFDWSGNEVTIQFDDSLRAKTTYVVDVGTDVKDVRAGNRMASAFRLAFTTGDSIDQGRISGLVFGGKSDGVLIFAYRLDTLLPDTLNPTHTPPDYLTQTGKDGSFTLSHLGLGNYRVLAVDDEYRNLVYDRQVDEFGVLRGDIELTSARPGIGNLGFRMSREDTTKPFIGSVKALDSRMIAVRMSEPIDSASFVHGSIVIADTLTGNRTELAAAVLGRGQPATLTLFTATPLDSPAAYHVILSGIADTAGNVVDSGAGGDVFDGRSAPDTLRRSVTLRDLRDSSRGVPQNVRPEILYSVPIEGSIPPATITLADSLGRPNAIRCERVGPGAVLIIPDHGLWSSAWYTIHVAAGSLHDVLARQYPDSTFAFHFRTADSRATGSVSGLVVDDAADSGRVVIAATRIDQSPRATVIKTIPAPGPFLFDGLPEGKYVLESYRDSKHLGKYFPGRPYPFQPSERFSVSTDTIRVRARWSVEGVEVRIPGR